MNSIKSYGAHYPGGSIALDHFLQKQFILHKAKKYFLIPLSPLLRLMPPPSEQVGRNALQVTHKILQKRDCKFEELLKAAERIELALALIKNKLAPSTEDLQNLSALADLLVSGRPKINLINQRLSTAYVKALWSRHPYCTPFTDPSVEEYALFPSNECEPPRCLNERVYVAPSLSMRPFLVKEVQRPTVLTGYLVKDPSLILVILDENLPFSSLHNPFIGSLHLLEIPTIHSVDNDATGQWTLYPCPIYLDQWIPTQKLESKDWNNLYLQIAALFDAERRLGLRLINDNFENAFHLFFYEEKKKMVFPANSTNAFKFLEEPPRSRFNRFTQQLLFEHASKLQNIYTRLPIHPHEKFVNCLYQVLLHNILMPEKHPAVVRQLWELSTKGASDMDKSIPWHFFTNGWRDELPKFLQIYKCAHPLLEESEASYEALVDVAKEYLTAVGTPKKELLHQLRHTAANHFLLSYKKPHSACIEHATRISRVLSNRLKCQDQLDYNHLWKTLFEPQEGKKEKEPFFLPILVWHALNRAKRIPRKALNLKVKEYLSQALAQQNERESLTKARKIWHNLKK